MKNIIIYTKNTVSDLEAYLKNNSEWRNIMTGKDLLQAMNELEDEMVEKSLQNNFQTNQTELIQMKQNHKSKVKKTVLK